MWAKTMRRNVQMQSRTCRLGRTISLVSLLLLLFCGLAQAQEIEGTWKLAMRKLPDGTSLVPPAVQGAITWHNGSFLRIVFWHTPEGRLASFSAASTYKISGTGYTETLLFSALDDGSGKAPAYNLTPETKSVPVTHEGARIGFKMPFDPPSFVIEGDKATAPAEGRFVDYWERVR
jgi:hypothetical protein